MNEKKELAVIVQQSQKFLPTLMRAVREADIEKRQEQLLVAYRQVDVKKTELQIADQCRKNIKTDLVKIMKDGKEVEVTRITDSRGISFLCHKLGRPEVTGMIRLFIANVNEYFNVTQGLNLTQIKEITEQIIDECGDTMHIDELIYIFKKSKTTAKLYNRLDGAIIFRWIDDFYKNRGNLTHKQYREEEMKDFTPTYFSDLQKEFKIVVPQQVEDRYRERDMMLVDDNASVPSLKDFVKTNKKKKNKK